MTWSGSWSRWRPAQPERRGSAIAAAIALITRAYATPSIQARRPKRDSCLGGCSALKAPPVKASARRRRPAVRNEPRKSGQTRLQNETTGCARVRRAFLSSPDLGCPQSPPVLLKLRLGDVRKPGSVRRWLVPALVEYNLRRVFISKRR